MMLATTPPYHHRRCLGYVRNRCNPEKILTRIPALLPPLALSGIIIDHSIIVAVLCIVVLVIRQGGRQLRDVGELVVLRHEIGDARRHLLQHVPRLPLVWPSTGNLILHLATYLLSSLLTYLLPYLL